VQRKTYSGSVVSLRPVKYDCSVRSNENQREQLNNLVQLTKAIRTVTNPVTSRPIVLARDRLFDVVRRGIVIIFLFYRLTVHADPSKSRIII